MKKLILASAISMALAVDASAWWTRVDCYYAYKGGKSGHWGVYRNSQNEYIEMYFGSSYCPVNIN